MVTYNILTQQNARETLYRLTGIKWPVWQEISKNYDREQVCCEDEYIKRILAERKVSLPLFSNLDFIFGHITTSANACESIKNDGLKKWAYANPKTELGLFLYEHGIDIDVVRHALRHNGKIYDISFEDCPPKRNDKRSSAWYVGRKIYSDYCICGFLSYSRQPYAGDVHMRPEILKNIDELLNTELAEKWISTHTPYEVVVRVNANRIVYDGSNSDSDQEKVMNYLMKAYWCSFSDMENIVLLQNDVEIQTHEILSIRPFNMWK